MSTRTDGFGMCPGGHRFRYMLVHNNYLFRYTDLADHPADALRVRDEASALALVAEIERSGVTGDRLGQYVRNFFECLELGEEGAEASLRARENPESLQRPV